MAKNYFIKNTDTNEVVEYFDTRVEGERALEGYDNKDLTLFEAKEGGILSKIGGAGEKAKELGKKARKGVKKWQKGKLGLQEQMREVQKGFREGTGGFGNLGQNILRGGEKKAEKKVIYIVNAKYSKHYPEKAVDKLGEEGVDRKYFNVETWPEKSQVTIYNSTREKAEEAKKWLTSASNPDSIKIVEEKPEKSKTGDVFGVGGDIGKDIGL